MARIQGFANVEATKLHAERYASVQHASLGRTKLRCSQAGFGCYRLYVGVLRHREALQMALEGDIAQPLQTLGLSEDTFGREVLPNFEISDDLRGRIAAQIRIATALCQGCLAGAGTLRTGSPADGGLADNPAKSGPPGPCLMNNERSCHACRIYRSGHHGGPHGPQSAAQQPESKDLQPYEK